MSFASKIVEQSTTAKTAGHLVRVFCVRSAARVALGITFAIAVVASQSSAYAVVVTDDFSDHNDTANPTWTHIDGLVGSTGQAWDASTGVYHVTAPSNGFSNFGAAGAYTGPSFTDVRVQMDVVDFHTTFTPPNGPEFIQVMARSNSSNDFLGLTGYAYGYDPLANAGAGEMVLYRNDVSDPVKDIGSQRVNLDETKDYRFILELIGNVIHGKVIQIDNGATVAELFNKIDGATNVYNSGTSGFFGYTQSPFDTDFSIDNFRSETAVAGDYSHNGTVDAADYVLWRNTLGNKSPDLQTPTDVPPGNYEVASLADMTANGDVGGNCNFNSENCEVINQADYDFFRARFGLTASGSGVGSGGAVPEPTAIALVVCAVAALLGSRRRLG